MKDIDKLNDIKCWLMTGAISIDDARARAEPIIKAMNARIIEIAKRHGVKPKSINFASFMR